MWTIARCGYEGSINRIEWFHSSYNGRSIRIPGKLKESTDGHTSSKDRLRRIYFSSVSVLRGPERRQPGRLLPGFIAAKGAWNLWRVRNAPAADFNGAKTYALVGCGMGIFVCLGLFAVFGGALFQMWQTEIGGLSMDDAFQFFASCALIFLIVNSADN